MKEELKDVSADNNLDFYYSTIENQDLVFGTIKHFETGPRKGFFEPLEFMNLLWKQYTFVKDNVNQPHSTATTLDDLPLNPEQKHVLFGFILKWCGGYPVNNHNRQYNSTLRLIENKFLAYEGETPEKEVCRRDWNSYLRTKQVNQQLNNWINGREPSSQPTPEQVSSIDFGSYTNSQIVLLFYYFYKLTGLEPRADTDIAPLAKFMHLITGKDFTKVANSDFYKKLQKAPNFKSDKELIKDLTAIKPLFEKVQLLEVAKMIDNETDTARSEIRNK